MFFVGSYSATPAAYADGVIPDTALTAYPGLDPRLVGVPIVKTELTAALVVYSEAVQRVNNLAAEKVNLSARVDVLSPEKIRAQDDVVARAGEFNQVSAAINAIVLSQYHDASDDKAGDLGNKSVNELRLTHQSARVSKSLRLWKAKAKHKMEDADAYLGSVTKAIDDANKRIADIGSEIPNAVQAAKDQKNVVRSGIPIATIDGLDIPVLSMDAYLRAERLLATSNPACGLTWWALAGIGRAESNHGRIFGGSMDANGTVTPAIIGVALNGKGFAAIGDSDQGLLDGDTVWDHAVGVMQFIPGTWKGYAQDGNTDGVIDPQNVYDAALAAANLLCANARPSMATEEGRRTAFMRYNASKSYVDFVADKGHAYEAIGAGRFNPAPVADPNAPAG